MCILIHKPKNVPFPNSDTLENCFVSNPDGAGFGWIDTKRVSHIRKGYMNFDEFISVIDSYKEKLQKYDVILHFRFATKGSVSTGNCHPFPMSSNIQKLKATTLNSALPIIAHNGIISEFSNIKSKNDLSDTMLFIKRLSTTNERRQYKILNGGKFAILYPNGSVKRFGEFIEDGGIYYSNDTYQYTYDYSYDDVKYYSFCFDEIICSKSGRCTWTNKSIAYEAKNGNPDICPLAWDYQMHKNKIELLGEITNDYIL